MTIPVFVSDHSIGDSIIPLWTDYPSRDKVKEENGLIADVRPIPIWEIVEYHNIDDFLIVDTSMSGFWEAYLGAKAKNKKLRYGIKLTVCDDKSEKTEESILTESSVIVFMKNSQAYEDLMSIYSDAHLNGFYYQARTDWVTLRSKWTANLMLGLPFYSSFIARNLLQYNHKSIPDFRGMGEVSFLMESHNLPFDGIIQRAVSDFVGKNTCRVINTHTCYYYRDKDAVTFLARKCINNRATLEKPQYDHFGSDEFSFESFLRLK